MSYLQISVHYVVFSLKVSCKCLSLRQLDTAFGLYFFYDVSEQVRVYSGNEQHVLDNNLKSIVAGEGPSEVRPVELDVTAAVVMSVGGSGLFSVRFTFLCRLDRCLLRFEVEFSAVDKSFLPTQSVQRTLMFLSPFTKSNSK